MKKVQYLPDAPCGFIWEDKTTCPRPEHPVFARLKVWAGAHACEGTRGKPHDVHRCPCGSVYQP